ncbi:1-phosphofructokinase [Motilimonas sp. KMU-193]|uniref:1-phosphofructokinase n=1 Tax=Motilimonas sp. KMU-193 TaxID=3388668 RepID=UPI00396B2F47
MTKHVKVVTVTMNPALDLTGHLDQLTPGGLNIVDSASLHPAGKGVNVAKVLVELGADVTVTGFLGETNQGEFVDLFTQAGLTDEFIRVPGATRINVKLVEQNQSVSDINFPGVEITNGAFEQLRQKLHDLTKQTEIFVIAGSLPRGVSSAQCQALIVELKQRGAKVFFDSSKQALAAGVKALPYLIKPNELELSELTARPLHSITDVLDAANQLHQQGCEQVVVSMGEHGLVWLDNQGVMAAKPPKVTVVSTVGAGDTLVAALCWGELQQWPKQQTLVFATALAAMAVSQVGVGFHSPTQFDSLMSQVQVVEPSDLEFKG